MPEKRDQWRQQYYRFLEYVLITTLKLLLHLFICLQFLTRKPSCVTARGVLPAANHHSLSCRGRVTPCPVWGTSRKNLYTPPPPKVYGHAKCKHDLPSYYARRRYKDTFIWYYTFCTWSKLNGASSCNTSLHVYISSLAVRFVQIASVQIKYFHNRLKSIHIEAAGQ